MVASLKSSGFSPHAYRSAIEFLAGLDDAPEGCVLTDVQMPDMTGLELLRRLEGRRQFPVVVLTGEADVPLAVEALKGGALDLLEKPCGTEALVAAVTLALSQLQPRPAAVAIDPDAAARIAGLARREREVLERIATGQSNKEVARDLDISPRTVEAYRASLMTKLGARGLPDLVRLVMSAKGQG